MESPHKPWKPMCVCVYTFGKVSVVNFLFFWLFPKIVTTKTVTTKTVIIVLVVTTHNPLFGGNKLNFSTVMQILVLVVI